MLQTGFEKFARHISGYYRRRSTDIRDRPNKAVVPKVIFAEMVLGLFATITRAGPATALRLAARTSLNRNIL